MNDSTARCAIKNQRRAALMKNGSPVTRKNAADINGDGAVGVEDYTEFTSSNLLRDAAWTTGIDMVNFTSEMADIDGDAEVTAKDLRGIKQFYGKTRDEECGKDGANNSVSCKDYCVTTSGKPSDMCFPYGNVSRGAGGEILEVSDPKFECIEKCLMTRYIDEERPYLALRMFDHADANRDGKVNAADLQPIKKFLDKGFGASYRAGYELVDYDQNKEVELWEYFMRLDSPEYASFQGKSRCAILELRPEKICTVCDDDDGTPESPCYY